MAKDDDKKSGKDESGKDKGSETDQPAAESSSEGAKTLQPGGGVVGSFGMADTLRKSFARYIQDNDVRPEQGESQLNVDFDFVKNHAGPMLASMLRDLTRSLVPKDLSFSVPVDPKPGGDDDASDAGDKDAGVNVNFDFGAFLGKLFQPPASGKDDKE